MDLGSSGATRAGSSPVSRIFNSSKDLWQIAASPFSFMQCLPYAIRMQVFRCCYCEMAVQCRCNRVARDAGIAGRFPLAPGRTTRLHGTTIPRLPASPWQSPNRDFHRTLIRPASSARRHFQVPPSPSATDRRPTPTNPLDGTPRRPVPSQDSGTLRSPTGVSWLRNPSAGSPEVRRFFG